MQDCSEVGRSLKTFHICTQMFNPWKKIN